MRLVPLCAAFAVLLAPLVARAGGDTHYYEPTDPRERAEVGVALRFIQRRFGFDGGGLANGYGVTVTQHAHFSRKLGAEVGGGVITGIDARGYFRTDVEMLLPMITLRLPFGDEVQPYLATGLAMTGSWYSRPDRTIGFMYAGNQTAIGVEWRESKHRAFLFEVATTLRGRFAVDKKDRPYLDADPQFNRDTRVVHELTIAFGVAFL